MRHFRRLAVSSVVPSLFLLGLHREVHLYLDAGTGSMVLQVVLGALVAIKLFSNQIRAFFSRLFHMGGRRTEQDEAADQ